jgi:quercetin 2,3-dioxygenase
MLGSQWSHEVMCSTFAAVIRDIVTMEYGPPQIILSNSSSFVCTFTIFCSCIAYFNRFFMFLRIFSHFRRHRPLQLVCHRTHLQSQPQPQRQCLQQLLNTKKISTSTILRPVSIVSSLSNQTFRRPLAHTSRISTSQILRTVFTIAGIMAATSDSTQASTPVAAAAAATVASDAATSDATILTGEADTCTLDIPADTDYKGELMNIPEDRGILKVVPHPSSERGNPDVVHWLNTYHSFAFGHWFSQKFQGFHHLRVLNEDRVAPRNGFGTHGHSNYEIFSYIVAGELTHKDSTGSDETLGRGYVQHTTAGSGVRHSEMNENSNKVCHFLQIWIKPNKMNLRPAYKTRKFNDKAKLGRLCPIVTKSGRDGSIKIHADVEVFASMLKPGDLVTLPVRRDREYYVHVVDDVSGFKGRDNGTAVLVNGNLLSSGDGAFLTRNTDSDIDLDDTDVISFLGASPNAEKPVEFIVFDLSIDQYRRKA